MPVIYDFGANNGDDIPYYLKKADRVIAVDANPVLTGHIATRFQDEIKSGRLTVLNHVLSDADGADPVPFYVHKHEHFRSQFAPPPAAERSHFDEIAAIPRRPSAIIRHFGEPLYVKIDVEGHDHVVLKDLLLAGIRPDFISAEAHHVDVFAWLAGPGGYNAFKLVDGPGVAVRYRDAVIRTDRGEERYSFPVHAAGPFGEDIAGPWMTADQFFRVLAYAGLGWKDVHAARDVTADPAYAPGVKVQLTPDF